MNNTLADQVFAFFGALRRNPSVLVAIQQHPSVAILAEELLRAAGDVKGITDEDREVAKRILARRAEG